MTYRKTWFDYVLWAVYAGLCIILLSDTGYELYMQYVGEPLAGLGALLLLFVLLCLYPGIRILGRAARKRCHLSNHFSSMAEALVISVSFVFGTIFRLREAYIMASIYDMKDSVLDPGDYYGLAMVRAGGAGISFAHGMSDLFINCLRVVLSFLGNSVVAAALFQVFLQVAAMVFAYLAVRKAAGRFASSSLLLLMAFSYSFVCKVYAINPECLFTALFLACLYLVISFVKASLADKNVYGGLPGAFLLGAVLGFMTYLEVGCIILFLFLAGLFTGKPVGTGERKRQIGRLFIVIAGGIVGFAGAVAEDASASGVVFYQGLTWWADTYLRPDMAGARALEVIWYQEYPLFALLFLSASFVVFEFIRKGRAQDFSLWFLPCILVAPVFLIDISVAGFSSVTFVLWCVMACLGLKSVLFGGQAEMVQEKIEKINAGLLEMPDTGTAGAGTPDTGTVGAGMPDAENNTDTGDAPQEKPRFIENPLPLPKKHVRREMDYDFDVLEADMHYDIEVAEEDDFDITAV